MSYSLNLDEFKARQWILNVENEISQCKDLLQKVSDASSLTAAEEDTILTGIENTCNNLNSFWNRMCDGFLEAKNNISEAIETMVKGTEQARSDIDDVNNKVGY